MPSVAPDAAVVSGPAGQRRIALLVEYDGTEFGGAQAQLNSRTVQDVLEDALAAFTGERQRVRLAGRTDSGVHALGQVVTLDTRTSHAPERFVAALNRYLPLDVAVRAACEVSTTFEPRRSARSRWHRTGRRSRGEFPMGARRCGHCWTVGWCGNSRITWK